MSGDSVEGGHRSAGRDLSCAPGFGDAARAMSAQLRGDPAATFRRVSTDSRTASAGDLFFCLRGPSFDGHDFIAAVAEAGAAGIVCERGKSSAARAAIERASAARAAIERASAARAAIEKAGAARAAVVQAGDARAATPACAPALLEVDDTLRALGDLAAWTRSGFHGPLVGVTGSNGKTTTKEMLRAIFLAHFGEGRVLATQGNLNNLIGVPLTLFGLAPAHAAAVIEMGMNVPGEIERLTEISAPTVGLITCVAEAHLEGLGSIEGVARAKGELFEGLPSSAIAVVNADDANVVREASRFAGRRLTFGSAGEVTSDDLRCDRIDSAMFDLVYDGQRERVELPLGGRHNVQNALGAAAAALAAGVPLPTIARGLSAMKPPPMRMSAELLANGVVLVNDAYNANPGSLGAALATMGGLDSRRLVVIGDMLELGPTAAELHRRVGEQAAAISPVLLCAYGNFAADVAAGATDAGLDASRTRVCARHDDAAAEVASVWLPGDAVLVKGSRGSAMEKVVDALRSRAAAPAAPRGDLEESRPVAARTR